ncbi:uncharacterized protein SCHCODRAFT_02591967 [Schizophyllum commune H4-8]|uniref:uncharacterized protein n=1 Tax=Schizophyllum commune (strain H4-8 / FGSC 9210) TaxID=578458 RepID=UPI00215F1FBB|nr:uncharacterized protein SCHCODRAFT_02591967 [Schizophyllum commune H4-8]KAI5886609.1 hypothetical protein SCHCODRAFT_02591967 [Schizophyllum commune H4-8]
MSIVVGMIRRALTCNGRLFPRHRIALFRTYACSHLSEEYVAQNRPPTRGRRKTRLLKRTPRTPTSNQSDDVSKLMEKVHGLEKQLASMAGPVRSAAGEESKTGESDFPPLPLIQSNEIYHRVFTNKMRMGGLQMPRPPAHTNAIYQSLGDAIVSLLAWDYLAEYLPNVKFMSLHILKGDLASNRFLGSLAVKYKLHRSLTLDPGYQLVDGLDEHKIHADLFEAYVGGLYYDQGLDAVREWLRPIFKAELERAFELRKKQDPGFGEESMMVRYTNDSPWKRRFGRRVRVEEKVGMGVGIGSSTGARGPSTEARGQSDERGENRVKENVEGSVREERDEETPHGYLLPLDVLEKRLAGTKTEGGDGGESATPKPQPSQIRAEAMKAAMEQEGVENINPLYEASEDSPDYAMHMAGPASSSSMQHDPERLPAIDVPLPDPDVVYSSSAPAHEIVLDSEPSSGLEFIDSSEHDDAEIPASTLIDPVPPPDIISHAPADSARRLIYKRHFLVTPDFENWLDTVIGPDEKFRCVLLLFGGVPRAVGEGETLRRASENAALLHSPLAASAQEALRELCTREDVEFIATNWRGALWMVNGDMYRQISRATAYFGESTYKWATSVRLDQTRIITAFGQTASDAKERGAKHALKALGYA